MENGRIDPPYKVLVVDDSAIVRGLVTRMLQEDPDIEVVGSVVNGREALAVMEKGGVEAVVLDIEMPVMDGLTALPKILEIDPTVRVIMASTLTKRNADISFQAMTLGAVDYVPKPSSAKDLNVGEGFRAELLDKVKAWAEQRRKMLEQTEQYDEPDEDESVDEGDGEAVEAAAAPEPTADDAGDESAPFRAQMSVEHQVLEKAGRIQRKRFTAELRPRPTQHAVQHHVRQPVRPQQAERDDTEVSRPLVQHPPRHDPGGLIRDAAAAAGSRATQASSVQKTVSASDTKRPVAAPAPSKSAGAGIVRDKPVAPATPGAPPAPSGKTARRPSAPQGGAAAPAPKRMLRAQGPITLLPEKRLNVEAIAIGSSTGGPQALFEVLRGLAGVRQPVFITQHMPATFTTILAEHITRLTGMKCHEGVNGEPVTPGRIYLAPGDYHMVIEGRGNARRIALNQNAPENFCRPSVDPMLRSLVQSYGGNLLTIILTGMGQDGMLGSQDVASAGGMVVAQDEATSVVWGMPGAAAKAGVCTAVLPLGNIATYVKKFAGGR
ncbi:chemotaxis protein CheB [Thalassospira sp.]|uniref:chemotaxis protein CheB n=1 Tax=Thalassospira sp. TaxID=1912094 RepID=UPI0027370952|nr:chemotaxis protein CheB [Thalassospira sp.]MDP2696623.1 chemotaxis protein CheB [Thalassospira sp.]